MKLLQTAACAIMAFSLFGQDKIAWSTDYILSLEDFANGGTEINDQLKNYSLASGTSLEFLMQKNAYAFAFSKNFNGTVTAAFQKSSATIVAPDSLTANQLLQFARYSFDLTEQYARLFRKRLYDEKETFSKANFYQPIFEQINSELNEELSRVMKLTDFGRKESLLTKEHEKAKQQIALLDDFCKDCKPPKKVKNKSK